MADNVNVKNNSGNVGTDYDVAADEVQVGGTNPVAKVQWFKLVDGSLNGTEPIPGTTANGLDVDVTRIQGVTLAAGVQVTVTGSAGTLLAANAVRRGLILRSLATNTQSVFYGPATVSTTTGMEIKPGETFSFLPGEIPTNLIQAISASGSQVVIVQESS